MKLRTKLKRAKEENERLKAIFGTSVVVKRVNQTNMDIHRIKVAKVCRIDDPEHLDIYKKAMMEESIYDISKRLKDDGLVTFKITEDPYDCELTVLKEA